MTPSIPVVDFSTMSLSIFDDDQLNQRDVKTTSDLITDAFTTIGFVYLRNTGFPQLLVFETNHLLAVKYAEPAT